MSSCYGRQFGLTVSLSKRASKGLLDIIDNKDFENPPPRVFQVFGRIQPPPPYIYCKVYRNGRLHFSGFGDENQGPRLLAAPGRAYCLSLKIYGLLVWGSIGREDSGSTRIYGGFIR